MKSAASIILLGQFFLTKVSKFRYSLDPVRIYDRHPDLWVLTWNCPSWTRCPTPSVRPNGCWANATHCPASTRGCTSCMRRALPRKCHRGTWTYYTTTRKPNKKKWKKKINLTRARKGAIAVGASLEATSGKIGEGEKSYIYLANVSDLGLTSTARCFCDMRSTSLVRRTGPPAPTLGVW